MRRLLWVVAASCVAAGSGFCQSLSPYEKASSGLIDSVVASTANGNTITLQFNLKNSTRARVYVQNAFAEERGFLGSGEHLSQPRVAGINNCTANSLRACVQNGKDLNDFSYIEPGDALAFSFQYRANAPVRETDTISFPVELDARFATPGGDPDAPGQARGVRFNYQFMPLNRS